MAKPDHIAELKEDGDIFSRPKSYRAETVLAVWERAKDGPKKNTKLDWRSGKVLGPWQPGENRDGIWDMGHIEPWYKVVERLKRRKNITREKVIDEFNNIKNLGVEDPEQNRALGVNSEEIGVPHLEGPEEEKILFGSVDPEIRPLLTEEFYEQKRYAARAVDARWGITGQTADIKGAATMAAKSKSKESDFDLPERVIVWDTETTGFSPAKGDKLVEVAAIELIDGKATGKKFHYYLNPERKIPKYASDVHGITNEKVKDAPTFREVADEFLEFVGDAPLVAHNANFDMRFINAELEAAGKPTIDESRKADSMALAKEVLPDLPNYKLDTLAEFLEVDTSGREDFHGGLVDTLILAEVFKALAKMAKELGVSPLDPKGKNADSALLGEFGPAGGFAGKIRSRDEAFAEAVAVEKEFAYDRALTRAVAEGEGAHAAQHRASQAAERDCERCRS